MIGNLEAYVPGDNFVEYLERLKQFLVLNSVEETKKVAFLLTFIGQEAYSTLKKLMVPVDPATKSYDYLIAVLSKHYAPKNNVIAERYKFHKEDQKSGQSIAEYIVELKAKAQNCAFGSFLSEALRDRLVFGIQQPQLRAILLKEEDLTFEKACNIAVNWELAESENQSPVNKVYRESAMRQPSHSPSRSHRTGSSDRCGRCAGYHLARRCPAETWTCYKCQKTGHIARCCRSRSRTRRRSASSSRGRQVKTVSEELEASTSQINCTREDSVNQVSNNHPVLMEVWIDGQPVVMECDSGACHTVLSKDKYLKFFKNKQLSKTSTRLVSVTGNSINVLGAIDVSVRRSRDSEECDLSLMIIETEKQILPLMGRSWMDVLVPGWRNAYIAKIDVGLSSTSGNQVVSLIKAKYPHVLSDLPGQTIKRFKGEIILKENATPVFHKAYTVPFKLRERVSQEIDRLCSQGILKPIQFSEWASPVVIVNKGKDIRMCIDCKVTINKYIEVQHYPIPRIDDIFASLAGCKYFCTLDLSGAYTQVQVSEQSRQYLTINTHKGLYQYTTLCFGVASAPSIFQSIMDQILLGIEGVACYIDDVFIGACSIEKCKDILELVLERLNEYNVRINLSKCKFFETSVQFLGHVISPNGIHPSPEKVKAILDAPPPDSLSKLQSYLGLLNYYGKFIPNLSAELHELYKLLRKDTPFRWTPDCQIAFDKTKRLLTDNNVLELYDPSKPIVVAADASPYGIGAILSHVVNGVEKPVLYASSTLSSAEANYSQIHREALAIVFAVKQFHKYIYGHKFTLCSDAQALKEIFNPNKSTSLISVSRLQRWSVLLSMYDYDFKYRSSKCMAHVDALSRLPTKSNSGLEEYSVSSITVDNDVCISVDEIANSLKADVVLYQVYQYVKNGWPFESLKNLSTELTYYYKLRAHLSCQDDCLFFNNSVVIPRNLECRILSQLHSNHEGIVRMKMLARGTIWFKNMNKAIEEKVKSCNVCNVTQNVKKEIVTSKWPLTTQPFERIHIDFFQFKNKYFLIVVDAFSKFIEVKLMRSINVVTLIDELEEVFRYFGLPCQICSDNGPPFNSFKFIQWSKEKGISLLKSPPYHPQSNGLAERGVQTVKSVLKKFFLSPGGRELPLSIMTRKLLSKYNNTPSTVTGKSPNAILFSYTPRTLINTVNHKFSDHSVSDTIKNNPSTSTKKVHFDLSKNVTHIVNDTISFKKGEKVFYRNHFKTYAKWLHATVVRRHSKYMYLINLNGKIRTVHINQIRPRKDLVPVVSVSTPIEGNNEHIEGNDLSLRRSGRDRKCPLRYGLTEIYL